jgi:hypothetical protein
MLLYFCFSHRSNGTLFFNKWKAFYDESWAFQTDKLNTMKILSMLFALK